MFQGDGQIDKKCRLGVRNQGGDRINAMVNACYGTLGGKLHLSNWELALAATAVAAPAHYAAAFSAGTSVQALCRGGRRCPTAGITWSWGPCI